MIEILDENSRFHRQELVTWWDQAKLSKAKVLVVGAGALGNEVVKNLVLVGVAEIVVCDMDTIENSNLSRCVFFTEEDLGSYKAETLAAKATALYSGVHVTASTQAVQRLGIAALQDFDLVMGALDNREARAWVNQACRKLGKPWIDAAIEGLRAIVRMFGEDGPCYACTLTEADYKQMSHRKSCALLSPDDLETGKTPTNATTASIAAAMQVQEAIKFLVGKPELLSLVGKAWQYTGDTLVSYTVGYQQDDYCIAHDRYELIRSTNAKSPLEMAQSFGENISDFVAVDFEEELITLGSCHNCGHGAQMTMLRSSFQVGEGVCSSCGINRPATMRTLIAPDDPAMSLSFEALGLAQRDIVTLRTATERFHFEVRRLIG